MRAIVALGLLLSIGGCDRFSGKAEVEEAVAQQLIDPTSPLFRGTARCHKDRDVWEGEVNGKNRFGAYVGFEPFIYADGEIAVGYDDYSFQRLFERCYGKVDKQEAAAPQLQSLPSEPAGAPREDIPFEEFPPPSEYSPGDEFDEELADPAEVEPASQTPSPKPQGGDLSEPDPNDPAVLGFASRNLLLA